MTTQASHTCSITGKIIFRPKRSPKTTYKYFHSPMPKQQLVLWNDAVSRVFIKLVLVEKSPLNQDLTHPHTPSPHTNTPRDVRHDRANTKTTFAPRSVTRVAGVVQMQRALDKSGINHSTTSARSLYLRKQTVGFKGSRNWTKNNYSMEKLGSDERFKGF